MSSEDMVYRIMSKPVLKAEASDKVVHVLELMAEKGVGSVVIVKDGSPVGILTERDIVKKIVKDRSTLDRKVEAVMSRPLITVTPETGVFEALNLMRKNKIRRLPVVSDGKLEGIVTDKDLLYWVLRMAYTPYPAP